MDKVVIVTGATGGIGKAIVESLAEQNMKVVACYNKSKHRALKMKENLKIKNIDIDIIKGDVSKRSDCKNIIDYTINKYGKIDILINNAGISTYNLFNDISDEEWNKTIDVNLNSVFYMSQEAIKHMILTKSGCIINISSIWGMVGASCEVAYSVSKAGVDGMTKSLAKELGPSNIRVNSIAPGTIDTDMNAHLTTDELNMIKYETPLQKIGKPKDIVRCINWLIEDEFTTGQVISINGGWTIV